MRCLVCRIVSQSGRRNVLPGHLHTVFIDSCPAGVMRIQRHPQVWTHLHWQCGAQSDTPRSELHSSVNLNRGSTTNALPPCGHFLILIFFNIKIGFRTARLSGLPCRHAHLDSGILPQYGFMFGVQQPLCFESYRAPDQSRHKPRPPCLVTGANSGPVVAVEILVKQDVVAPVRIFLAGSG